MPDPQSADTHEKQNDVLSDIRAQLRDLLPRAVRGAVASYQDFSENVTPDDAKQFIVHHNACRAALAHLESLSKLTRWLLAEHPQPSDRDDLQPLLLQARHVLTRLEHPDMDDMRDDESESGPAEF